MLRALNSLTDLAVILFSEKFWKPFCHLLVNKEQGDGKDSPPRTSCWVGLSRSQHFQQGSVQVLGKASDKKAAVTQNLCSTQDLETALAAPFQYGEKQIQPHQVEFLYNRVKF